jgi:cell division septum initiation protein DivIVA
VTRPRPRQERDTLDREIEDATLSDAAIMDPVVGQQCRRQAAQARDTATQARAQAETLLAAAREQARRLLADAEQQARNLTATATAADQAATDLEGRAVMVERAHELTRLADEAEQHAAALADEYTAVTGAADDLAARLAELGRQREDATATLAAARDSGNVPDVANTRTLMSSIDEVAAVAAGKLDGARHRAQAIGQAGWGGEYDQALAQVTALRGELSSLLDTLDPTRPTRRSAQATTAYAHSLIEAGVPEEEALRTAALLVAVQQYPEAAVALFSGDPGHASRQRLVARTASAG